MLRLARPLAADLRRPWEKPLPANLACLRGCGLVKATREGRQVRYELADPRLAGALRELARVVLDSPACPDHLGPRR